MSKYQIRLAAAEALVEDLLEELDSLERTVARGRAQLNRTVPRARWLQVDRACDCYRDQLDVVRRELELAQHELERVGGYGHADQWRHERRRKRQRSYV